MTFLFYGRTTFAGPAAMADTVLINGHILTMNDTADVVEALAVRHGKIVAVGSNALIGPWRGPATHVIDLRGQTATPGLIDAHAHIASGGAFALYAVNLDDAGTLAEVRRRIATGVASLRPGEWLRGYGWDEGKLAEARYIVASDLDDVSPVNPVWLEHTTGHYGVANSAALERAGIDVNTPNPQAGTIDHGVNGRPTGVLKESAADAVRRILPPWSPQQQRQGILASIELMHQEGMTGVKDPDILPAEWRAYESLARAGRLAAHVCVLWHTDASVASARVTIEKLGHLPKPPMAVYPNLVLCGAKLYMDGSGGARTAWMYDEWHKDSVNTDTGNRGYPLTDPAVYREQVRLLHGAGIHVGTHAIGDRAIDWVAETYALVLKERPTYGLRHSLIHANTPTDHAIDVMAQMQRDHDAGYPESQPPFSWWLGDTYAANLGAARALRLNPYHTYLERGVRWAGGSDYDVTPLPARYGLWASILRMPLRGTYGTQPFGTLESVDISTALKSYTRWAAPQLFLEHDAGSLELGKSADVAVWDRDMTAIPAADLKELKCDLTLFRGRVVYSAPGSPVTVL